MSLSTSSGYLNPTGRRRISISSTTTVYLVGFVIYTVAAGMNWNTDSIIQARLVR